MFVKKGLLRVTCYEKERIGAGTVGRRCVEERTVPDPDKLRSACGACAVAGGVQHLCLRIEYNSSLYRI